MRELRNNQKRYHCRERWQETANVQMAHLGANRIAFQYLHKRDTEPQGICREKVHIFYKT